MTLEIRNVTKSFRGKHAVDRVSLRLEGPCICGLLGRNGAGKTTLMNLISGKTIPTEGETFLDGEPVRENDHALEKIFSMGEVNYFPLGMKVCEVFTNLGRIYPNFDRDYAEQLSKKFELDTLQKNDKLSTGYATILKLVAALSSGAEVLLLDEPVLGLDANCRDLFYRELMENYAEHPRLILFSTHLIEEAAKLIERAVIIRAGQVLLDESIDTLLGCAYSVSGPAGAADAYAEGKQVLGADSLGGLKTVYLRGTPEKPFPAGLELGQMSLQKLFIELTNH